MEEPEKTYVCVEVFFERLADDGWPEDAGLWPIREWTPPIFHSHERVQRIGRLSQLIASFWDGKRA